MNKIKSLKQKFNTKFTEKDKLLFDKLDFIEEKFNSYQDRLEELKKAGIEFEQLCSEMDKKSQKLI